MKQLIRFIVVAVVSIQFTACGSSQLQSAESDTNQNQNLPSVERKPIFRSSWGGMMIYVPEEERVIGSMFYSDGTFTKRFADGHEVVIGKVDVSIAQSALNMVNNIVDADSFELVADGQGMLCDAYSMYEIYINGVPVVVEQQENCGSHKVLAHKADVQNVGIPDGSYSLYPVAHSIMQFASSVSYFFPSN